MALVPENPDVPEVPEVPLEPDEPDVILPTESTIPSVATRTPFKFLILNSPYIKFCIANFIFFIVELIL